LFIKNENEGKETIAIFGGDVENKQKVITLNTLDQEKGFKLNEIPDMPSRRSFHSSRLFDKEIFLIGSSQDHVDVLNIDSKKWISLPHAKLTTTRKYSSTVELLFDDGKTTKPCFLAIGGYDDNSLKSCELFDIESRKFNQFPAEMNNPRCYFGGCSTLNGDWWFQTVPQKSQAFVFGGYNNDSLKECEVLLLNRSSSSGSSIPTYEWKPIPDMPNKRYASPASQSIHSPKSFFIFGGDGSALDSYLRFDSEKEIWTEIASMNRKRSGHCSVNDNHNLHFVFGSWEIPRNASEMFDETQNKWINLPNLPFNVYSSASSSFWKSLRK
jgi:hypothetical protein